jgi:hypothetical protein
MRRVFDTTELSVGNIVLSGSFYFMVEGITPTHFSGKVWNGQSRKWGRSASVPLPSPCHLAYLVDSALPVFPEV